ncbi:uncharacterized protein LOC134250616 [Saccostrea cucullata]|uniref:uncharacterized protein LOC134250616 n=1 Tax=Saccostrea cuccullata TaxID=36930 RepID=UPI002ED2EBC0
MILFIIICAFASTNAHTSSFYIPIREKSAIFNQEISTNLIEDVVEFHTPAHNNVLETFKIQDFKNNVQAFCMPQKKECFVSELNRTHYPNAGQMMESFAHVWNTDVIGMDSEHTHTLHQRWYKSAAVQSLSEFSTRMRQFLHSYGYPIFQLKKIEDDALILEDDTDIVSRPERTLIPNNKQCDPGVTPVRRYGYTLTNGCDWLYFCDTTTNVLEGNHLGTQINGCTNTHVRDQVFYSCLCCPNAHRVSDCLVCNAVH